MSHWGQADGLDPVAEEDQEVPPPCAWHDMLQLTSVLSIVQGWSNCLVLRADLNRELVDRTPRPQLSSKTAKSSSRRGCAYLDIITRRAVGLGWTSWQIALTSTILGFSTFVQHRIFVDPLSFLV